MTLGKVVIVGIIAAVLHFFYVSRYLKYKEDRKKMAKDERCKKDRWWRPYLNHTEARERLRFRLKFRVIPGGGLVVERWLLEILSLSPFIGLFHSFPLRLFVRVFGTKFYKNRDSREANRCHVDIRILLLFCVFPVLLFIVWLLNVVCPPNNAWVAWVCSGATVVAVWRLIELLMYAPATVFLQHYRIYNQPQSIVRSLILLLCNYLEIIFCFAILYLCTRSIKVSECGNILDHPFDALYFSIATITTLGYGDFRPINLLGRFLVSLEVLMGILFVLLIFADYVQRASIRFKR